MGYTHYWTFKKVKDLKAAEIESRYQLAVRQCQRIIRAYNAEIKAIDSKHPNRLSGYSAHTKVTQYGGINFNGTGDLSHENFCLREHFIENLKDDAWGFCKTARKPYDVVVVACLIILKHYLGNAIDVSSDGTTLDWSEGLILASQVSKIKTLSIPKTIDVRLEIVS